jgi:PST family polysaccharide transporter
MNLSTTLTKPIASLKKKLNNNFIRNLGWLGGAEALNRIFRLATTLTLARTLNPYDFGLAALVLTTYEFTLVFTRIGIGGKIIQAEEKDLEAVCNGAYWLNWVIGIGLFILQCIIAFPAASFYQDSRLIVPICLLGLVFIVTPVGRIQAALIQRENRLKVTAKSAAIQSFVSNFLTVTLAILGWGMWAIILPRIFVTPIDIYINLKNHPWRIKKGFTTERWEEIFKFGMNIFGISLLDTLRNNLDYLIVGRFLGVTELGIYFFAFNAGLGISTSIIQNITLALYPHLCAARGNAAEFRKTYFSTMKTIAKIIVPFVLFQSTMAPFYVPIIFGKEWEKAIPVLIIICLSAIPRPFFLASINLLAVIDKPELSLRGNVIFTVVFALSLLIGVHYQVLGVAISVLLSHALIMPLFTMWATRYVFGSQRFAPAK